MALRSSSVPLHVPLPPPHESSLAELTDLASDSARAASPTISCLLATDVTDPSFEYAAASALVAELLDFAAACHLDYASALVAESVSASPPSVGAAVPRFASMLLAPEGDSDAPDIPTPRSYAEAITGPYSSQWQAAMDAEMASWKSTNTYVDTVPTSRANIVDGMWIFRAKRPPGSPPAFKACYLARGFSQRQEVDYFQTFSPTPKMTTLRVLLHVAAQRDYALHSLDFSAAILQGSLHEEIWLRRPPGFTGSFPTGTQWSLLRPVYGLRQAPRKLHDTVRTTLAALGFAPATADPSLFLRTDTSLPPFYVLVYVKDLIFATADSETLTLVLHCFGFHFSSQKPTPLSTGHSLSAPPLDESVESSGPYQELVGCLITSGMGLVLGGRGPVVLTGHADTSWVDDSATQRSSQGYTFSLGSGSVSWRSTSSSSVLSSNCEAEIYAGAMAAQELRLFTYLLTDLGEQPHSPPDWGITVNFPAHGRTAICTNSSTGAVTFTKEPHSGLFFLHTLPPLVAASGQVASSPPVAESGQVTVSPQVAVSGQVAMTGQVAVSGLVAASCSCRSLAHPTVLWHHRLGHPSLPHLRSMASHFLLSGLPHVFSSLPPSLASPCTPCVAGRLHATPHSSSLRLATAHFQTLHLDVWGLAPTLGPKREHYFLVAVDEYSRYTTVFPLAKKSEVTSTLIRWLLATEGTRGSRVRCLHSDHGGEFCCGVLAGFCGEQGIRQSWTLSEFPQQNGVAERRIGLVMVIAHTSMIHAHAPHFLWPYVLRYAAHQLNLQPRISGPEVSPTSLWTGSPGVRSVFRLWGCLALVRYTSVDKLSARAIPRVFLGFLVGSHDYSFYHPPLNQFLDSRDVRFDKLITVESIGVGARGATTGDTRSGGACSRGPGAGGAGTGGASSGGAGAGGTGTGGTSFGGARAGGADTGGASSGGAGAGCAVAVGAGTEETGAGGSPTASPTAPPHRHDTRFQALRRLEREEQEQLAQERQELQRGLRALGLPSSPPVHSQSPTAYGPTFPPPDSTPAVFSPPQSPSPPLVVWHDWTSHCPPRVRPSSPLANLRTVLFRSPPRRSLPVSVLPSPPASSLTIFSHPITEYYRAARPVVSCVLASLVTDPCASPSSVLFRSPPRRSLPVSVLPSPPASSLTIFSHPITDYYCAARPVVSCVLASLVTDPCASPSFVSALNAAVADFASTCRLDYPPRPLSVGGESALGCESPSLCAMLLSLEGDPDALDIPTPHTYREAVSREWASQWKAAMGAELASWRSTGTYVDAVPPPRANIVDGMWLFKVKWPPGSPPVFKARYVARGFTQCEGVDFFQTFAPTPKMTTLWGRLHEEIWLRRPPDFTNTFPPGTQWSLRRRVYDLRQSPREWHDTLRSTLYDLGFRPSSADPLLFVRTGSTPFFILVFQFSTTQHTPLAIDHRLTGPFPDEPFESSGPYTELVGCLMSTRSSCVASSSAEAEIYDGAMAAQELCWLTFLLTDLGERPRSAPALYADNKATILLCREPRL
ncbi:unnamed protein product [Closterium sp. NIES-53]